MLFTADILNKIKTGEVTSALRKWRKPTVKQDGTLITRVGQLSIDELKKIALEEIDEKILQACGVYDLEIWKKKFYDKRPGELYLISFSLQGPDPRIKLRENIQWSTEDLTNIKNKLNTWDKNSNASWTQRVMTYILAHPKKRAADMAVDLKIDKATLKLRIRKLKALGLTISHSIGYELSPRGKKLIELLTS